MSYHRVLDSSTAEYSGGTYLLGSTLTIFTPCVDAAKTCTDQDVNKFLSKGRILDASACTRQADETSALCKISA